MPVEGVDDAGEVDDAHQHHEEDRDGEGELDEPLAPLVALVATLVGPAHHGVTTTVRIFVSLPPRVDTTSVTLNVPCDWY